MNKVIESNINLNAKLTELSEWTIEEFSQKIKPSIRRSMLAAILQKSFGYFQ